MQPQFSRESFAKKTTETFTFPDVGQYPMPADFYTILQDYQIFLEKNKLSQKTDSWDNAFDTIFKRYKYHITGTLDHSKPSFKKLLEEMRKKNKTVHNPVSHIKNVHDHYAWEREQTRLDELEMLGRMDDDGYADY